MALGLFQTKDMFEASIMGIKPLKIREGKPEIFNVNWDLNGMRFDEIVDPSKRNPTASMVGPSGASGSGAPPSAQNQDDDDMPDVPF